MCIRLQSCHSLCFVCVHCMAKIAGCDSLAVCQVALPCCLLWDESMVVVVNTRPPPWKGTASESNIIMQYNSCIGDMCQLSMQLFAGIPHQGAIWRENGGRCSVGSPCEVRNCHRESCSCQQSEEETLYSLSTLVVCCVGLPRLAAPIRQSRSRTLCG